MDLPSGQLGEAFQHTITLDTNANGAGWYVERSTPAAGRVDLLTVLAHEIGHVLGYDHSGDAHDLMAATLPLGTRRLPGSIPVIASATSDWLVTSPLLLAEHRLDTTLPDLVDHSLLASDLERGAGADSNLWLLPLSPTDYGVQPQRTSDTVRVRIVKTITDEQMALLDDERLDLIAASQQ